MKRGAWIHSHDALSLDEQIKQAAECGLQSIRSYTIKYSEQVAPALHKHGMSLVAGMGVRPDELIRDWRSQVRLAELARCHELGVDLEAICVGNELGEKRDNEAERMRFTARLSFNLANVLAAYREWLDENGHATPLTYAMEGGSSLGDQGVFHEWMWPLIDACDVISVNLYPMGREEWFTFGAFEKSRLFLHDSRVRNGRLVSFELELRRILDQLAAVDKPLILSETGFPSATGYRTEDDLVVPENDGKRYGEMMHQFIDLINQVNADYEGRIQALYFYEWRDNLHHDKITRVDSPIHTAFGLCDRSGREKFDVKGLLAAIE